MTSIESILQFWFHSLTDATPIDKKSPPASLWFNGGKQFDKEVRRKFELQWWEAKGGGREEWGLTARGRLALVILFDQFPRNIFRNTPQMFATDPLALDLTQRSIKDGFDQELMLIERVFLYMPFMHSESLDVQEQGVRQFASVVEESKTKAPHNTAYFKYNLDYAQRHRDIIATFGRFPHRNRILERESTPEETAFLAQPNSSF